MIVHRWQKEAILKINNLKFVEVVGLIVTNIPFKKLSFAYGILNKIDQLPYHLKENGLEQTTLDPSLFNLISLKESDSENVTLLDIEIKALEDLNPDLIINLNPRPLSKEILKVSDLGVWEIRIGDSRFGGFNEVITNNPVSSISVVSNGNGQFGNLLINHSVSRTERYSILKNWNNLYWKVGTLLTRSLKKLYDHKEEFYNSLPYIELKDNQSLPNFFNSSYAVVNQSFKIFTKLIQKKTKQSQWYILIKSKKDKTFKKLFPPKGHIWADPFIIEEPDYIYIYVEETETPEGRGFISVLKLDHQLNLIEHKPKIIDKPFHLSYPCVFKIDEKWYMIPESFEANNISLYECTSFPYEWEFTKTLMSDVIAFDATPFYHNKTWYLFVSMMENFGDSHSDELFLFWTEDILNPKWKSVIDNPIVSDVRKARPAGHIIEEKGLLLRPAQDGSVEYGYAIVINEIQSISRNMYKETISKSILPEPKKNILRRHTINFSKNFEVQDALRLL